MSASWKRKRSIERKREEKAKRVRGKEEYLVSDQALATMCGIS